MAHALSAGAPLAEVLPESTTYWRMESDATLGVRRPDDGPWRGDSTGRSEAMARQVDYRYHEPRILGGWAIRPSEWQILPLAEPAFHCGEV